MKKAAVIGMGVIAPIHFAAIAGNPNITLAGVCDIEESRREAAPEGVPFFTDFKTISPPQSSLTKWQLWSSEVPLAVTVSSSFTFRYIPVAEDFIAITSRQSLYIISVKKKSDLSASKIVT